MTDCLETSETCRKPQRPVCITKNLPETCQKPTGNLVGMRKC